MKRLWSGLRARVILVYLVIFLLSAAIMIGIAGTVYSNIAFNGASARRGGAGLSDSLSAGASMDRCRGRRGGAGSTPSATDIDGAVRPRRCRRTNGVRHPGNALATSLSAMPANQRSAPEVQGALSGWIQHAVRFDSSTNQTMIFAAAPMQRGGHVFGIVQVAVPLSQVTDSMRRFWVTLGITALVAAAAAALVAWLLAGQLVGPVMHLRDAAVRIAAGDLDQRVPAADTGGLAEISQLAESFNYMAERIEEMMNQQRAFVANASHELRTPLTNIKLRAEALGNGALDDPAVAHRFVGEIESEANRLGRMASDLLTLSRHDAVASGFREAVDPAVLVDQVAGEMALRAEKGGVALVTDVQPVLGTVMGDPVGLHAVLTNLVDNALQYTPAGGTVTIRALAGGHALILQVRDTGAGVPADDLPHIFERFYRADKARSRRLAQQGGTVTGGGAGLGLAIVRGIVEEHGGSVEAESIAGEGTTVTVILPLNAAAIEQVEQVVAQ